jgi:hypothetical protein
MLFYAVIQINTSVLLLHEVLQHRIAFISKRGTLVYWHARSGNEILRLKYLNGYYTKYK